ncbi:dTDP-4-dehydrorhamnose reductase [Polaromonas sp. UC242_47]|uniref:dTDP-4-dehydrorhamnose reductase n=1 Tax=Polaromonas sp. UC242_47 TaxID=3374626 RepID=UPI0037A5104F
MKILLFGKNGQLGWELQRSLGLLGELVALDRRSCDLCGDLTNLQGLANTVQQVLPDVIVNAAAYTAVDNAESESELARLINATAPGLLAQEACKLGAWLVHYSTDYVFDGSGTQPWLEADVPAPLNVYGQTKLDGEQLIAKHCKHYLIFRTSWIYSARGGNFVRTMLRLAREREHLTVIEDQFGAPTGAELLADVTAHAIHQVIGKEGARPQDAGLYHLTASGETTWHEYASRVIDHARQKNAVAAREMIPVPTSAFPTPARRPHNSRLDSAKLQATFGLSLPPWQHGVDRTLAEILGWENEKYDAVPMLTLDGDSSTERSA